MQQHRPQEDPPAQAMSVYERASQMQAIIRQTESKTQRRKDCKGANGYLEQGHVNIVRIFNVDVPIRARSAAVELEQRLLVFVPLHMLGSLGGRQVITGRVHHSVDVGVIVVAGFKVVVAALDIALCSVG